MKVLYDYQVFFQQRYGGVSRYYIELMKELNEKKKCQVMVPIRFSKNEYLRNYCGKTILETYFFKLIFNRYTNKYIGEYPLKVNKKYSLKMEENENYDIIHPTWTDPYINEVAKGKMVVTIHDMIHELFLKKTPETLIEIDNKRRAIYDSTAIIAISESTKRDILKLYSDIPEHKIYVIYHGTNHLPEPKKPHGFDMPEKYILYVGRRENYKRADFLLDSSAKILKKEKELCLFFVGGGAFNNNEKKRIKELGIEKKVIQQNVSDEELAYLYQHARCFVYPSLYEGFGFPILEAFDNNCPVICTHSSSLPEVGGNAALYFDVEDSDSLNKHIIHLISDSNFRDECIAKGKERVKLFSWENCAKETLRLYQDVVNGKFNNL